MGSARIVNTGSTISDYWSASSPKSFRDTRGSTPACAQDDELTPEQVREIIIQLISYIGYSSSSDLYRVSETAIATYRAEAK